jgi:hypothetical protein
MAKKKTTEKTKPEIIGHRVSATDCVNGITPLDLAHLTAKLKLAGIIPSPPDEGDDPSDIKSAGTHRRLIVAAAEFIGTCEEVKTVILEAQKWKNQQSIINESLSRLAIKYPNGKIPIREVIEVAKINRLKLSSSELNSIQINQSWEELDSDQQAEAIFLLLSGPEFRFAITVPNETLGTFIQVPVYFAKLSESQESDSSAKNSAADYELIKATREGQLLGNKKLKTELDKEDERARKKVARNGIDLLSLCALEIIRFLQQAKLVREPSLDYSRRQKSGLSLARAVLTTQATKPCQTSPAPS